MREKVTALVAKADGVRRMRTPGWRREEIIAAYKASGMPGTQFAASCGLKYSTLMRWVRSYRKGKSVGVK